MSRTTLNRLRDADAYAYVYSSISITGTSRYYYNYLIVNSSTYYRGFSSIGAIYNSTSELGTAPSQDDGTPTVRNDNGVPQYTAPGTSGPFSMTNITWYTYNATASGTRATMQVSSGTFYEPEFPAVGIEYPYGYRGDIEAIRAYLASKLDTLTITYNGGRTSTTVSNTTLQLSIDPSSGTLQSNDTYMFIINATDSRDDTYSDSFYFYTSPSYDYRDPRISPVWQVIDIGSQFSMSPSSISPILTAVSNDDESAMTIYGEADIQTFINQSGGTISAGYGTTATVSSSDTQIVSTLGNGEQIVQHFVVRTPSTLTPVPAPDESKIEVINFNGQATASIADTLYPDSTFTAHIYYWSPTYGDSQPTETEVNETDISPSSVSLSYSISGETAKTAFQSSDFPSATEQVTATIYGTYTTSSYGSVSGSWRASLVAFGPSALQAEGTDTTEYWAESDSNVFEYPTVSFSIQYNDGSSEPVEASEITYTVGSYQLRQGNTIDWDRISPYAQTSTDPITIPLTCTYNGLSTVVNLHFSVDKVTDIAFQSGTNPVLGNTWMKLRQSGGVVVKVTMSSGSVRELAASEWRTVSLENTVVMSAPTSSDLIQVSLNSLQAETGTNMFLDASSCGWTAPAISGFNIDIGTAWTNKVDRIDLTRITGTVTYSGADYQETGVSYSASSVSDPARYTAQAYDSTGTTPQSVAFDGSAAINLSLTSGSVQGSFIIRLTVTSRFSASTQSSFDIHCDLYDINDIIGIRIVNANTEYTVGDSFLNSSDDADAIIYFRNAEGDIQSITISLTSDWNTIAVNPAKGTILSDIGVQTITVSSVFNSSIYAQYSIKVLAKDASSMPSTLSLVAVWMETLNDPNGTAVETNYDGVYALVDEMETEVVNGVRRTISSFSGTTYGYLTDIFETDTCARVILWDDYVPPVDGEANITVYYPCWQSGYTDRIDGCRIGALFGNSNAKNRLFVSGNSKWPNVDWYSGRTDDSSTGGFGYFEDTSYCAYGTDDTAVVGYHVSSDDTLAVFKEASTQEPCIYFRTSTLVTALDASGNTLVDVSGNTLSAEAFTLTIGNAGAGALKPYLFAMLNGDALFVSGERLICGLDSVGPIGTSKRTFSTRSYYIDPVLSKEDLEDGLLWTDNTYLYMCLPTGIYITQYQSLNDESLQYEWWHLDIKGITAMGLVGGETIAGTSDGRILKLNSGGYADIDKSYPDALAVQSDDSDYLLTSSDLLTELVERSVDYDRLLLKISATDLANVYERVCYIGQDPTRCMLVVNDNGEDLRVSPYFEEQAEKQINEGEQFVANLTQAGQSGLGIRSVITLKLIEDSDDDYQRWRIYDSAGNPIVNLGYGAFAGELLREVVGTHQVINADTSAGTFQLRSNLSEEQEDGTWSNPMDLVAINPSSTGYTIASRIANLAYRQSVGSQIKSEFQLVKPVVSWYLTAPFTMGPISYRKTIWTWTITADTGEDSDLEMGRATNSKDYEKLAQIIPVVTSDTAENPSSPQWLDFKAVSFSKTVVPKVFTVNRQIWNIPFICFGFRSTKEMPSVLSTIEVVYSVPVTGHGRGRL